MPKKPMCPTESSPVNPTTKFRLMASIAQMPKTVAMVMANPAPCHSMNPMAHDSISRLAHSSMLLRPSCSSPLASRAPRILSTMSLAPIRILRPPQVGAPTYLLGIRPRGQNDRNSISSTKEMTSFHSPARSQMPNCSTIPSANPPTMAP